MKNHRMRGWLTLGMLLGGCGGGEGSASGSDAPAVKEPVAEGTGAPEPSRAGLLPYRGINLAGAEFGSALPGTHGTTYVYPDPAYSNYMTADYYIAQGMNTFRLPFKWERLQRTRNAAFDAAELTRLKTTVNRLTGKGTFVILDPHNYARYNGQVIGAGVPNADFADFWKRLATEFKGNPQVLFGLMNEPYSMPTEQWLGAANAAIQAIRAAGAPQLILVPGNAWTGAHSWGGSWYGTPNATAMLGVQDPGNHYAFEAHQYLDGDSSGTQAGCVSATIGAQRMQGFTNWLRAHGKKGFLGEFAGGPDAVCLSALDNILGHLEANADVYLGWTYWAGGPWWGDYFYSLEPQGGTDTPQLGALSGHL
ncbi:glycoside hydrolase family 5 protein [Archangium primigenium]|uniref:glycoside hydrolase family 5 protein n=1 Tax=[Archangium] primigenium TaxID=2792470 RepID=UPI00195B4877|nr:glycoside hydrolase family 5 protein [Archangium primigenium]MBM7112483.1 glycoside hydrolase family 5 protein [Archangium primigenium]